MLNRQYRLRRRSDFARVHARGRVCHGPLLSVKIHPNRLSHSRAGVMVGLKISKKAVVRNRIRRRIQGQLREIWPIVLPGYDLVVMPRPETLTAPIVEIKKSLLVCLDKNKLLH